MRSVIFGHLGFVGAHLENALKDLEHDVYGFDLKQGQDIRNYEQVRNFLDMYQPDYIFHLAAMAVIGESQLNPHRAVETHILGSMNILEAARQLGLHPKIHFASTSEEYGYENQTEEVTEKSPVKTNTVYGATKAAMTNLAMVYNQQYGMHIVVTRAFNHIGPGKSAQFADTSFAKQIVHIERGEQNILRHGNLETIRNYTDVRDIVRAYISAVEAKPGIYNVCSDNNVSMQELLDSLITASEYEIPTEVDEHRYRPGTSVFHAPSYTKLNKATGWKPEISFKDSIRDVLADWRERCL